jgi:hypothetical protein
MADETETKAQKARESCLFRVFSPILIRASEQWIPGSQDNPVIADLSDVEDEMIRWMLEHKMIESADGKPINIPTGNTVKRKPCPCSQRS